MTFYNVFFPGLVLEKVKQNDETQSGNEKEKKLRCCKTSDCKCMANI